MATRRFRVPDDTEMELLYSDMAEADLQPLWMQTGLLPKTPNGLTPHIWRWDTLRHLAERCGELVGIDRGGDRRALALAHPGLEGRPFATHTLWAAVQFLKGGETAPAHRHSPAALRFVLEGSGVWSLVNGEPITMNPGDLVLTPSWNWHEHHNGTPDPMIWFDGLDLPLVRSLDAMYFEDGPDDPTPHDGAERSRSERAYGVAGIVPAGPRASAEHSSPLLSYRWEAADRALSSLLELSDDGFAAARYADPTTGRDVMPTMRAEIHRILPSGRSPSIRTAGSAIVVVFRGSGASVIDGVRYDWNRGDMFVVPSWAALDHEAQEPSDLFVVSDAPVLEALGLRRTEVLAEPQAVLAPVAD